MKPKYKLLSFLALAGSSLLAVSSASAQTGTWNVDANGLWGTDTNWASNTIADGAANTANFTNNITADRTVSLDTDRTINRVNFADGTISTAGSWILDNNGTSTNNLILSGTTGAATGTVPVISVATLGTGKTATISAVIEGSYGFTKSGTGTLVLSGDNTYTGVTTHVAGNGIIIVAHNNALGSTAAGSHTNITLSNGDGNYIGINNGVNTAENFTISGSSGSGSTAIRGISGTATLSGTITLAGSGQIRLGSGTGGNGALIWDGTITQSTTSHGLLFYGTNTVSNAMTINGGALTIANGSLTLNGVNPTDGTGLGDTSIFQSSGNSLITLGVTNALRTDGNLSFSGGTGRLNLNGNNQTIKGLIASGAGTREVHNNINATTSTLTVGNGGGDYSFNGVIRNNTNSGTGVVALVKTGAGNQTLSGINTFTGGTRIDDGTLTLGHATDTLANTGAVNVNGGTLALGANNDTVGSVTLTSGNITGTGGTLTGTGSSYDVRSGSVSAILGGSVGLTKSTSGTVTLTGANSYSGATSITGGTLLVSGSGSINSSSGVTISSGAEFKYNSSTALTVGITNNGGRVSGSGNLGAIVLNGTGSVDPGNSPGIMAAGSTDPSAGLDYNFEFTAANTDPTWSNATASGNDVLRLTGGTPFGGILDSDNVVSIYLDVASVTAGQTFTGGFFTDLNSDFLLTIQNANFQFFIQDAGGMINYNGETYTSYAGLFDVDTIQIGSADFSGGTVTNGWSTQFTAAIPEPGAALLGSLGLLALLRRRR